MVRRLMDVSRVVAVVEPSDHRENEIRSNHRTSDRGSGDHHQAEIGNDAHTKWNQVPWFERHNRRDHEQHVKDRSGSLERTPSVALRLKLSAGAYARLQSSEDASLFSHAGILPRGIGRRGHFVASPV